MFLPITKEEMNARGWDEVDFVLVTGDAYVDHHSFGTAIIGRLLESRFCRAQIINLQKTSDVSDVLVWDF